MTKTKKILVLGIGQSNFLNQLYENILIENKGFTIDINEYFDISKGKTVADNSIYNEYFDFNKIKPKKINRIKTLFQLFCMRLFWEIIYFEISQNTNFKKIIKIIKELSKAKYIVDNHILPLKYDLIHFHFCIPENVRYIYFLPKEVKSICSYWGSDLLRVTGVSNVFYMQKALKLSTVITIQTRELAEILFCKYGREFTNKTEILLFTISPKILNFIDFYKLDKNKKDNFKIKYSIPIEKEVIVISHNGFIENNHLKILNEINKLPETLKSKIVVLIPLGYGGSKVYFEEIKKQADLIKDINIVLLYDYFDAEEIALLRLITTIMIHMPISDALSAAMTEVLYAENKVITGSWLPYGLLKRKGLLYKEIDDFDEIVPAIILILNSIEINKNPEIIQSFLLPNATTPKWNNLFNKVINA